jgi:hypothetical protein
VTQAKTTSFSNCQYKKKIDRVSPGFDRVDRVPGRPGFTGPISKRVFASTRIGLRPGSAGSTRRAGPGFKTLVSRCRFHYSSDTIATHGRGGLVKLLIRPLHRAKTFSGVYGGRFPWSSYGIATR